MGSVVILLCISFLQASLWIQRDEKLFREAKILLFDEEWEEALAKLDEFLEDYPESPFYAQGLFWKATCLKEIEGNEIEAIRTYKEYIRINEKDKSLNQEAEFSIIDLALALYDKGRLFYLREVEERLHHEDSSIQYYAAFELSYIEDKDIAIRAVPILQRILQEEDDERLRARAKIALMGIDPDILREVEEKEPYRFQARVLKISVHEIGKREPEFFISIPWSLADLVFSVIPEKSRISLRKQGVDIDKIVSDLTRFKGSVFEVRDDDEGIVIKIWLE